MAAEAIVSEEHAVGLEHSIEVPKTLDQVVRVRMVLEALDTLEVRKVPVVVGFLVEQKVLDFLVEQKVLAADLVVDLVAQN